MNTLSSNGITNVAAITLLVAGMVIAGWFLPPGLNVLVVMLAMIALLGLLGITVTKNLCGVLISDRNLMSLARFQMATWTVVVLGAYLTFALMRIKNQAPDPLNITIDWHLWTLLGISTTSLVGAPLILSTKKDRQPAATVAPKTAQQVNEPEANINANRQGTLYANAQIGDARITDMFQGDELTNTAQIDLAKVQMFYFTIIALVAYVVSIVRQLQGGYSDLGALPVLPDGLVAILGISHGGYLVSKSINHTQSQNQ